ILDHDGCRVGSASCFRQEDDDIFLITISELVQDAEGWSIQIRNNDSRSLRFLAFRSSSERGTLQPRMALGQTEIRLYSRSRHEIEVRNWGTADLIFTDRVGQSMPGTDLVKLTGRPESLKPHCVGELILQTGDITGRLESSLPSASGQCYVLGMNTTA